VTTANEEKYRRMALRRDIGNRLLPAAKPKPLGPAYLFPYACFTCQKSFKRKVDVGLPEKTCPHCGSVAVGLSRNFKAPRADDVKQWKKVAFLVKHGFRFFHQYDAAGLLVAYPSTMSEAKEFVARYGKSR
jgi:DNA-directed RNA polymerase subunit RPC12/RpoP